MIAVKWLSVHIKDLENLPADAKEEFKKGNFTVKRTRRKFSAIGLDHAHEQLNKIVKTAGGATRILDNDDALTVWSNVSPIVVDILKQFSKRYKQKEVDMD